MPVEQTPFKYTAAAHRFEVLDLLLWTCHFRFPPKPNPQNIIDHSQSLPRHRSNYKISTARSRQDSTINRHSLARSLAHCSTVNTELSMAQSEISLVETHVGSVKEVRLYQVLLLSCNCINCHNNYYTWTRHQGRTTVGNLHNWPVDSRPGVRAELL